MSHWLPGIRPEAAQKTYRAGTHRSIPPEETVRRVRGVARALGITRVANVTGLDTIGIPVAMACRPNSRSLSVSQGKGLTLAAAQASALMEALELHHAERITHPLKLASYDELRFDHRVADPSLLPRPASSTYRDDLRVLWIEADDLMGGDRTWIPFELVHIDCARPSHPGAGAFRCSSNGLASGNTLCEAAIHGLSEVIEREAFSDFERIPETEQDARRVNLDSVDDPSARWLLERFAKAHVDVVAWDITDRTGVPSFKAGISTREDADRTRVGALYGFGCHPARGVALCRALTEAAQTRLTVISGARDDLPRAIYESEANPERALRERGAFTRGTPSRAFHAAPSWESNDLDADVTWLLDQLRQAGFAAVYFIDLTMEALRIPVVRVVVPGARGMIPHAATG